jgi:hypothetical protein
MWVVAIRYSKRYDQLEGGSTTPLYGIAPECPTHVVAANTTNKIHSLPIFSKNEK